MSKTYQQLEAELLDKTKGIENLKERVSNLRGELLEKNAYEKRLIRQYERIVKEWKDMYGHLVDNGWRIVFVKVMNKYNQLKLR